MVGAMRGPSTSVITEDLAVGVPHLAEVTMELQKIFKKFQYDDAVIFGHALEGNLHLVFSQNFETEAEIKRYTNMMNELCELIAGKFDGSLKAEHGTGRSRFH